jgi:hypothetical protein
MENQLQSEQTNDLVSALVKASAEIKTAKKDAENPFFKSKYSDLPSIVDACKSALLKNNLVVTQSTTLVNGVTALVTTLHHTSGQWIRGYYPVTAVKADPQAMGSAITYARRYALSAIVGVVSEDDDDGESAMGRSVYSAPKRNGIEYIEPVSRVTTQGNSEEPIKASASADGSIDWKSVKIHFGKNKDMALGTLTPRSLSWWIREWTPQPFKGKTSPQDEILRSALDQAALEVDEQMADQNG